MSENQQRKILSGLAISVRGNDIDTDRIIPARFLKCITFEGLGPHVFTDDRMLLKEQGQVHPFDRPERQDAQVLLVNKNFGCGSSREHAPQALRRWNKGIRVIIGESFAEIFFGNATAGGMPCLCANERDIQQAMDACEANPELAFTANLETMTLQFGKQSIPLTMPQGPRHQMLEGRWDATVELLQAKDEVELLARRLPYFNDWGE